jgi:hypothetical protein
MSRILYVLIFVFSVAGNVWAEEKVDAVYLNSTQPTTNDEMTEARICNDCEKINAWSGDLHNDSRKDKKKVVQQYLSTGADIDESGEEAK